MGEEPPILSSEELTFPLRLPLEGKQSRRCGFQGLSPSALRYPRRPRAGRRPQASSRMPLPGSISVIRAKICFNHFPIAGYFIATAFCQLSAEVEDNNFIGNIHDKLHV